MDNEAFVSGVLVAILRASRVVGLAPLSFKRQGSGWQVRVSRTYSLFGFAIFTIINLIVCWSFFCMSKLQANVGSIVWMVDVMSMTALAGTMVYSAPKHLRCLLASINKAQKINSKLNIHGSSLSKKQTIFIIIWGSFSVTIIMTTYMTVLILFLTQIKETHTPVADSVAYFLHFAFYFIVSLGGAQFAVLALHVRTSFQAINNCLRSMLKDMKKKRESKNKNPKFNNYVKPSNNRSHVSDNILISSFEGVRRITMAYMDACDIVRDVDRSYGLMVFILLANMFLWLTTTSFHSMISFVLKYDSSAELIFMFFKLVQFCWGVYHALSLALLIEPCHATHVEAERTRELASHLIVEAHSVKDPLAVDLELFSRQLALNDVSYKPLNVTTMSRGLALTIYGSIATYLVFLIDSRTKA